MRSRRGTVVSRRGRRAAAFTLVEVLLATLVLGLFLSVTFSIQAGSIVLESRARLEATASDLIRCRMSEIELELAKDGFPLTDEEDSGPCCEFEENERYQCTWTIESILLPSTADIEESAQQEATSRTLVSTTEGEESSSFAEQAQAFLTTAALGRILPVVQGFLRDAIRKVEVTIVWRYRSVTYDFTVTQYVVNTSQGALGGFLQQGLVQQLMQGGNAALFQLLFGEESGGGSRAGPVENKP